MSRNNDYVTRKLSTTLQSFSLDYEQYVVADPDLKLRGAICFACPADFSSFYDFLFFPQNKGGPPQIRHWDDLYVIHIWFSFAVLSFMTV